MKLYPVKSSSGSSIIVLGHDEGLTVLWRGGQAPRPDASEGRDSDVMVLDDEQHLSQRHTNTANAHSPRQTEESTPQKSHEPIVAVHEITLPSNGPPVAAVALAVAPLPADGIVRDSVPAVFSDRIVVAVACSDRTNRLVSLPVDPHQPHRTTKFKQKSGAKEGVDVETITEAHVHDAITRGLAFTYTQLPARRRGWDNSEDESEDDEATAHTTRQGELWQLLIASYTTDPSRGVVVARLTFTSDRHNQRLAQFEKSHDVVFPPGAGVAISFNPARHPSKRHSQLLFADSSGAVRIYETKSLKRRYLGKPTFVDPDVPPIYTSKLVSTFFAPFQRPSDHILQSLGLRNRIVDAQWVLNGKAILALLDDGHWGIWDYMQAGPRAQTASTTAQMGAGLQSVPNAGISLFSLQGFLGRIERGEAHASSKSRPTEHHTSQSSQTHSSLAPMTPKTRKSKQTHLFSPPSGGLTSDRPVQGKISVATNTQKAAHDDSLVISYDSAIFIVPSLLSYWKNANTSSASDSGSRTIHGAALERVTGFSALGELITSIAQAADSNAEDEDVISRDILVPAEHRLAIWCPVGRERSSTKDLRTMFQRSQQSLEEHRAVQRVDQDRLSRAELDLTGLDRVMSIMDTGPGHPSDASSGSPIGRRHQPRKLTFTSAT